MNTHTPISNKPLTLKQIQVVSLLPEMIQAFSLYGVTGRAVVQGVIELGVQNPRDFTQDRHRTVDDRPFGGGPGMVMQVGPLRKAIQAAKAQIGFDACTLYLSPQGRPLTQQGVVELTKHRALILVAGRYEGIDERLIETEIDQEWSIGDFVISGGELAALVLIDALLRTLPGVLGHAKSAWQDSFSNGLLDCPHYTRPENETGKMVPKVLLSGDHAAISKWRLKQSLGRTWQRRPDLLQKLKLSEQQQALLAEFIREQAENRS